MPVAAPYVEQAPATAPAGWQASAAVIAKFEKDRPGFLFREDRVPAYDLPDVLAAPGVPRAATAEDWEKRVRPALLKQFERCEYGRAPVAASVRTETVSQDAAALNGQATRRELRVVVSLPDGRSTFAFTVWVFTPNAASAPAPAFLLLNNRPESAADPTRAKHADFWPVETLIARGYATAVLHLPDVQPDKPDGLGQGAIAALPVDAPPGERWATLAAWAWAAGRTLDALETVPQIDAKRVAVVGHSRGGKTALLAGAIDPRFAMVIANCSGCGGAALARRGFGETLSIINRVFPHWFCENYKAYTDHPERLPIDQHQLLALIAPRPLYIGCADEDLWADPRGEYLALCSASQIDALYGLPTLRPEELPPLDTPLVRGPLAFHVRRGVHDLTAWDWQQYLAFADRGWKRS